MTEMDSSGHQIMTYKSSSGGISLTIVNTKFTNMEGQLHSLGQRQRYSASGRYYVRKTDQLRFRSKALFCAPLHGDCFLNADPNQGLCATLLLARPAPTTSFYRHRCRCRWTLCRKICARNDARVFMFDVAYAWSY